MTSANLFPTYRPSPETFLSGHSVYLRTFTKDYLDFAAGIATNILGYGHSAIKEAFDKQLSTGFIHLSNMYHIPQQQQVAEILERATNMDCAFFTNSGTEAVECAIKTARHFHHAQGRKHQYRIISVEGCFHGRSMGALAATNRMQQDDSPPPAGFGQISRASLSSLSSLKKTLKPDVIPTIAALIIEPIQGEGGIYVMTDNEMQNVQAFCAEHHILLICDEIQCGNARTGDFLASKCSGITPDILCLAKGIGGGVPVGVCLAKKEIAKAMTFGTHGSTFGGNPLAMTVMLNVLDVILKPSFLAHVAHMGAFLKRKLENLQKIYPRVIVDVRGRGLMLGLKMSSDYDHRHVVDMLREKGLLVVAASVHVIRFLPPLIIEEKHVKQCYDILFTTFATIQKEHTSRT